VASRRMISQSLGDSEKFASLANDTHRLAYVLLVTYADAEGRFLADAVSLRGKLYTRMPWTADMVEAALLDAHDVDLIRLYVCGKHRYGVIVGFHEHNTIRRNPDGTPKEEAASRIPVPPDALQATPGTGAVPEPYRRSTGPAQAEVEVEREVEREEEQDLQPSSADLAVTRSAAPTRANTQAFIDAWNEHRGHLPAVQALNRKRTDAVKQLVKEHDGDALALFRDATLAVAADDYWVQRQYGFDNLVRPGRVLEKAEKFRAGGTGLGDARIRMLSRAERWAAALPEEGSG